MSTPPNTSPIPKPLFTIIPHRVVSQPSPNGEISDKTPVAGNTRHCSRSPNGDRTGTRNLTVKLKKMVKKYNELDANSVLLHAIYTELHDIDENIAKLEAKAHSLDSSTEQLKTQIKDMCDNIKPTVP